MPTNPSDIPSYASGVDFKSANVSGGAITDLVTGLPWTFAGAAPTFSTRNGVECWDVPAVVADCPTSPAYFHGEFTMVAMYEVPSGASHYIMGDANTAANGIGMLVNAQRVKMFHPSIAITSYTTALTANRLVVGAVSYCPEVKTAYASGYDGTHTAVASDTFTTTPGVWQNNDIAAGRVRTAASSKWLAELHIFHRSLHYRDNTTLQDLMATIGAKAGL